MSVTCVPGTSSGGTTIRYAPLFSVTEPTFAPSMYTVAPAIGTPTDDVTRPLMTGRC